MTAGGIDAKKLKGLVDEIEASEARTKSEGKHRSEIYKNAQSGGYNPKALRKIIQARRLKEEDRAELDNDIAAYELALGMAVELVKGGMSLRRAEMETGIAKSVIHRAIPVPNSSRAPVVVTPSTAAWSELSAMAHAERDAEEARKEVRRQYLRKLVGASDAPPDTRTFDEIAGEIPPFMRRSAA